MRCTRTVSFKQFGSEEFDQCIHDSKFKVSYTSAFGKKMVERVCGKHKSIIEKAAVKSGTEIKIEPLRGGERKGAGRPKTKEDTKVMRVPLSKVEEVNKVIKK